MSLKLLVDSHVFLWAITADGRLGRAHRRLFTDAGSELWLSVASLWEMVLKAGLGKLPLPLPATDYLLRQMDLNRVTLLPLRPSHLTRLETLPHRHRDPFDRLLVAQAAAENMTILSDDSAIRKYGVPCA